MRFAWAVLLLLVHGAAWAQSVVLPAQVKGSPGAWIIIAPESVDGGAVKWRIDPGLQEVRLDLLLPPELLTKLKGKVVTGTPGRYKIEAWCAKGNVASDIATCWVEIVGSPTPPDPKPPKPPEPKPPEPKPPEPDGIVKKEVRVLIVYESADLGKMPPAQQAILFSQTLRAFLDSKCAQGPKNKEWRIYDKDVDTRGESKIWQEAMKQPRQAVPWLQISHGINAAGMPVWSPGVLLPADVDATIKLLKESIELSAAAPVQMPERMTIAERVAWWERSHPQYASKP